MVLLGSDNLIGDTFSIEFKVKEGRTTAWIVNKFGLVVCYLDQQTTYKLDVFRARNWSIHCQLAQVLFSNTSEDRNYWGKVAIICNNKKYDEAIENYLSKLSEQLVQGILPRVDLSEPNIDKMLSLNGQWVSSDHIPVLKQEEGTVVVKSQRSLSDKLIEAGRAGNAGCYAVSWAFILLLIMGAVAIGAKLMGFF